MAPVTHTGRSDKDRRITSILSFATDLQTQLPTAVASKTPGSILNNIENHLSSFPSKLGAAGILKSGELDSQGTELWNLCTRLRRDFESHKAEDVPIILTMARVFAFLLLASAHEHGRSQRSNVVRLLKTGLKTTKTCLDTHQYDLALKALEKVASYLEILKKGEPGQSPLDWGSAESYSGLTAEYFILRTALAWRHDDLKLAEYMYEKSTSIGQAIDPKSAENLADVLFEMGKDFFTKKEYVLATKWLERSYDVLSSQELDRMSMDASELRTSVISLWIKALLGLTDERSIEQANNLVGMLGDEQGDKLVVLLLRLEIISETMNESFDIDSYYDVLQRMTRTVFLSDSNLKLLMTHIRKLNDKSPTLACAAVDELFRLRMLKEGRPEWIEKLLVMRILMGTRQSEGSHTLASLEQILSDIGANLRQPISLAGVHAAHTLLWRRIESNFTLGQHELAERWCHLAMHKVFEKSGDINMTRISRKLLLCALARKDINNARELFGSMSDEAKNEPLTRFLMYKIAIRCGEIDFAAECLDLIGRLSGNDCTLIFACVLDAQQVENKQQALEALQILHEKYDYGAPPGVHFPSLLRATIRLTDSLLRHTQDVGGYQHETTAEKLCKLFEGATASIKQKHPHGQIGDAQWNMLELEWFSKNSYNLAVKNLSAWKPQHSVRILLCCINFIDAYPDDIGEQAGDDLALKKMFCEFSVSIALTSLARGEDNIEKQLQAYIALRKHVESYDKELQKKLEKLEESPAKDLLQKLAVLIAFDFEAACHLKTWDALGDILLKAEICKDMKVYELMADCILSTQAPPQVLMNILRKIVNEAWALEQLDIFKLSKYMRCLFQTSLSANMDIAEELLAQVQVHAEQAVESEQPYPHEELEWMATRAFNRAVDLYCGHEDEACRRWAQNAIGIAQCCGDDGALEKLLQSKLVKLTWDNDA